MHGIHLSRDGDKSVSFSAIKQVIKNSVNAIFLCSDLHYFPGVIEIFIIYIPPERPASVSYIYFLERAAILLAGEHLEEPARRIPIIVGMQCAVGFEISEVLT